jgi:tetratricopeptide (TPR) repeat protein
MTMPLRIIRPGSSAILESPIADSIAATFYLTLGEYQKAIDDLSQALTAKHNDPIALTKRGQAEEALGRSSQALDDFRAALSTRPELQAAREGLDRIMALQKRSDGERDLPRNP